MADQPDPTRTTPGGASPGAVVENDGHRSLRFARILPSMPDTVWAAITERDLMGQWAFAGNLEPRVGGSVHFGSGETESSEGRVIAWEEPRILEYRWGQGVDVWRVRFELRQASDAGTTLVFEHLSPDPANPEFAAGWHWHLDRLGELLRGDVPSQVDEDQHFRDLLEYYGR
ncbi:SRPBCC family protein [Tessaracoccus antarcticus]|uniref:SRPBCC family protein n=1 Tax=Tessaracoccus antarcticus TaxID=2479848 RepID=A0A3M0G512_9ACTN|nr:SRPBCC family protein [Tessaracoccus antarcticus]RMB59965.1 SRPBCC family protein [Tessaracoccus antarcticus]